MKPFMPLRWAFVGLVLVSSATVPVGAQSILDLPPGSRIRVDASSNPKRMIGTLVRAAPDTLWVHWAYREDVRFVLASDVRKLEVSRGSGPRRIGQRAWKGFLIGAGVGAVIGGAVATNPEEAEFFGGTLGTIGAFALTGAVPGALIGTMTAIPRPERWEPVIVR